MKKEGATEEESRQGPGTTQGISILLCRGLGGIHLRRMWPGFMHPSMD